MDTKTYQTWRKWTWIIGGMLVLSAIGVAAYGLIDKLSDPAGGMTDIQKFETLKMDCEKDYRQTVQSGDRPNDYPCDEVDIEKRFEDKYDRKYSQGG